MNEKVIKYEDSSISIDALADRAWKSKLENKIDKLEQAVRLLASWCETAEWQGALDYIDALLDDELQK